MGQRSTTLPFTYVEPSRANEALDDVTRLLHWGRLIGHQYLVPAGTTALRQGRTATHVLLLESGTAMLRRTEASGVEVAVGICASGAVLGLASVLRRSSHAVSAVMRSDGEVIAVSAAQVTTALGSTDVGPALIDQLAGEHLGLIQRYAARTALSVRDRVLRLLSEETRQAGRLPCPISIGPSDLAGLVGADASHVYRVLRELKAHRIIDFARGRIVMCRLAEGAAPRTDDGMP